MITIIITISLLVANMHVATWPFLFVLFLPYIAESNKKPLAEYFPPLGDKTRILISHNDLYGIQMGPVVSKIGFEPKELEEYCTCCINGHLHNGQTVTKKVLNLGNLTGKEFGEDAGKYPHRVLILDTDTMKFEFVENPHAFNFYRLEIETEADIENLTKLKDRAVLSIKCKDTLLTTLRAKIEALGDKVIESRVITVRDVSSTEAVLDAADLAMDHTAKFAEFVITKLGTSKIVEEELSEVLK